MLFFFGRNLEAGQMSKFGLNSGPKSQTIPIPDLVLPVQPSIYILIIAVIFLGAWQMARGIRSTGLLLGIVAFIFIAAFLIWAARGKSLNLVGMLSSSLVRAIPIALAALCGLISERAAVINIAIEGIMLIAAEVAVVSATVTHNLYIGLMLAILSGGLVAAAHAFLVIRFKVDQIVSGVAINIFATGMTSFISSRFLQENIDTLNNSGTFPILPIPGLVKIPILGPILFENGIIVYLTLILVVVLHIVLFYTPWGLRTRAVGEHPKAADTLGVTSM